MLVFQVHKLTQSSAHACMDSMVAVFLACPAEPAIFTRLLITFVTLDLKVIVLYARATWDIMAMGLTVYPARSVIPMPSPPMCVFQARVATQSLANATRDIMVTDSIACRARCAIYMLPCIMPVRQAQKWIE
jgi:hypothetical protein